jgi:hypothetical protein
MAAQEERLREVVEGRDDYGSPCLETESVLGGPAQTICRAALTGILTS